MIWFFTLQCCRAAERPQLRRCSGSSPLLQTGPPLLLLRLNAELCSCSLDKTKSSSCPVPGFPRCWHQRRGGPCKAYPRWKGLGGFPCLAAGGTLCWVRPTESAFLVKYRAMEGLGSILHWCGEGKTLPCGLPACSLDGRWTLPSEKLQWLLVSTRRRVSYLYPIYTDSYPRIGITIFM